MKILFLILIGWGLLGGLSYFLALCRREIPDWYEGMPLLFKHKSYLEQMGAATFFYFALPLTLPHTIKDLCQKIRR